MWRNFELHTVWRVAGSCGEVAQVLSTAKDLLRWWPAVFLQARPIEFSPAERVGGLCDLHTTGWLPDTLRLTLTQTEPPTVTGFTIRAEGDVAGTGRWQFTQDGPAVEIRYDWRVILAKRGLRWFTPVLKLLITANYRWAMRTGKQSLKLELRRRRADSEGVRRRIPAPSRPTLNTDRKDNEQVHLPL